ncbi:MAG: PAS domain S-box protein, partial [Chloroflexi bacterium]|nr:PAS domain S-box protein [Chloroflexota bacterium]
SSVGADLVDLGFARASALGRSVDVLGRELLADAPPEELPDLQGRLATLLAGLAEGFTAQFGERILTQQETIREALLTQRDQAEAALRESEARFRATFASAPFGIAVADMQGRILSANPALQTILGWTEDEMRGRLILAELAHPEDAQAGFEAFVDLAAGRTERYEIEQRFFTRDGRTIWVQLAMALVRDVDGNPQFAIGMGIDITERKRAEAERLQLLREQAARAEAEAAQERLGFLAEASAQLASSLDYSTTLQQVAQAVVPRMADWVTLNLLNASGELRQVASGHTNAARERLANYMRDLYPRRDEPTSPVMQVLRTGASRLITQVTPDTLRAISQDDEHLRLWQSLAPRSVIIVPLTGHRGVLGTLSLITTSDSERRYTPVDVALAEDLARRAALAVENAQLYAEAQAAIQTAEAAVRAREEFLSVAAHELKTPVTSLRGFAQLTLRALEQDREIDRDRLHHALTVVNQQSDKLRRLVAQLLDVSRIQSGRLQLELEPVDLSSLVREVATSMRHQSQQHELRVSIPGEQPVRIDPLRLEQVLTNLVDNAIKYSPQGGPIDIDVSSLDPEHVRIAVRDRGPGIRPEHRAHIFERFYQAGAAAEHAAGMGLGLYISREIVELHGGTIEAEFPPDGGARFVITLPSTS